MPFKNKFLERVKPTTSSGTADDYLSTQTTQKRKAHLQPIPAGAQTVHFSDQVGMDIEEAGEAEEDEFEFPLDPKALRDYESAVPPTTVGSALGKKVRMSTNL